MSEEPKALTDTEINKILHNLVTGGKGIWHEELPRTQEQRDKNDPNWYCSCGEVFKPEDWPDDIFRASYLFRQHLKDFSTNYYARDYLKDPVAYVTLLFFCVNEWKGWEKFCWYLDNKGLAIPNGANNEKGGFIHQELLKDKRTLPVAVAEYLKGGE